MNMQNFYDKYNLNKYFFGEMAHVGSRTLLKYAQGKSIREDSRERIELAIHIVEEHNLIYPRATPGKSFDPWYNTYHFRRVQEYKNKFQKLLEQYKKVEGLS